MKKKSGFAKDNLFWANFEIWNDSTNSTLVLIHSDAMSMIRVPKDLIDLCLENMSTIENLPIEIIQKFMETGLILEKPAR